MTSTQYAMQYAMDGDVVTKKRQRHRRGGHVPSSSQLHDDKDEDASLTYSAASSMSSAGESTDSSLGDIMRALEGDAELIAYCKKDPSFQKQLDKLLHKQNQQQPSSEASVTSSLNYSTDGESALNGEHVLQTITGQPSDSYGPDGGGFGSRRGSQETLDNLTFREADPSVDHKVDSKLKRVKSTTPKSKNTSKERRDQTVAYSTPPTVPRRNQPTMEEEVWYAKWWMCGFTDAFRDMVPKR